MSLTASDLRAIAGPRAKPAITAGVIEHLPLLDRYGITEPHRLAQFLAQIAHESARFATTQEYASGAAYEGRKDLGNTQKGDGRRFKGHGTMQVTGRANHRAFTKWARPNGFPNCPDFEKEPEKAAEFPWALIGAVWYWQTRNLNKYADAGNIEAITRKINGGLNGYADRCELYARTALVILGYALKAGAIRRFQMDAGFKGDDVDDLAGAKTRAAMHAHLVAEPTKPTEKAVKAPPAGDGLGTDTDTERPSETPAATRWADWAGLAFIVAAVVVGGIIIWMKG